MKRKLTFLSAAFMLLAFLAVPLGMRGQTTVSYGWETSDDADPWTISEAIVATSGQSNTGDYAGKINTNSTTVQFNEKVYVTSFSYAFKRTSNNNNYSVYIETSTDGSTWSIKDTQAMNTFTNGSYRTVTKEFDGTQELYVRFRCNNTTAVRYVDDVTITYATSASQLEPCDLTLTNASTSIVFDLYNNSDPYVINYTTSSTGEVTVADSEYITTEVDQTNKTITVTPVAVTNGAKVITVNQAADDNYAAGSKTFTINITDSTPFTGGDVTFDATVDKDLDNTTQGEGSIEKLGVIFACNNGILGNGSEYRMYKNSVTTFSVSEGTITQIAFTGTSGNPATGFATQEGWTTDDSNGTWTGNAQEVSFTASGAQVRATMIVVTVDMGGEPTPSITVTNPDEIAYDATSGSFNFTVNNPVDGANLSATDNVDWIDEVEINTVANGYSVTFATTANEAGAPREGVITITYTYGDSQTVTKNVTVTQNGNPNATMTIAEVRAQGTGAVVTRGVVTSCVGTTGYIQDATAAICVYGAELTVGDEIRVSGTLSTYNGLLEITSPEVTVLTSGNTIDPELMTIAEILESTNQGWFIRIEEAIVTAINSKNVTIAQGESNVVVRFASADDITFEENDIISLNGNIGAYNGVQIANPQNVEVQAAPAEPSITLTSYDGQLDPYNLNFPYYNFGGNIAHVNCENFEGTPTFSIQFCNQAGEPIDVTPDWFSSVGVAVVDNENVLQVATIDNDGEARTAYFKVGAANGTVMVYSDLVTVNQAAAPQPSITLNNYTITVPAAGEDAILTVQYENIDEIIADVELYDADGNVVQASYYDDWFTASLDNDNNVSYTVMDNDGAARSAYFKVYAMVGEDYVYSNLVTVNQAEYVVDYAALPFAYDGNGQGTLPSGLTVYGTGTYNSSPKIQFNNADGNGVEDYVILKINEEPGVLTFDIKGNSFSGGTFRMQTSVDGITYTDKVSYTEMPTSAETQTISDLASDVRYIKWSYTKVNGNVAFGNITLAQPDYTPSITVNPDLVNAPANGEDGALSITLNNMTISDDNQLAIVYYYATGEQITNQEDIPSWLECIIIKENEAYVVYYSIGQSTNPEEQTACFKVYGLDDDGETEAYSNLVTINQEAYVAPVTGASYTLVKYIRSGRRYIITNGSDKAMGGQNNNNRAAVEITTVGDKVYVDNEEVVEFVINEVGVNGFYTIYDANVPGYLYAASSSSNYLRTETHLDANNNGIWTIQFAYDNGAATVMAQGNNDRNMMRYNSGSNIFSCYGSGQQPVYFYMKDEEEPEYTFYKDIKGYNGSEGGYYLIASPIVGEVNPATVPGMTEGEFDLYWFDQTQNLEWRNYEAENFNLVPGKGYLYANNQDVTLAFTGILCGCTNEIPLIYDENAELAGWNLIGNPYDLPCDLQRSNMGNSRNVPYYRLNEEGSDVNAVAFSSKVAPMEGVFVYAYDENLAQPIASVYLQDGSANSAIGDMPGDDGEDNKKGITLNITHNTNAVVDRAIVTFGEGYQLPKFQLNPNNTKVYFSQGVKDYAIVRSANQGEMPVNFKAKENGSYTISVSTENLNVAYLHLIDNRTGADIDLLLTPSYTFEANAGDNANRFRLVFNVNNGIDDNTVSSNASFAYFNGSEWVISNTGNATLQVVDMMGRVLSTEAINGNTTVKVNQVAGVYMLRLVSGNDVKVQKMVVK